MKAALYALSGEQPQVQSPSTNDTDPISGKHPVEIVGAGGNQRYKCQGPDVVACCAYSANRPVNSCTGGNRSYRCAAGVVAQGSFSIV
jgi:hypothetical protein